MWVVGKVPESQLCVVSLFGQVPKKTGSFQLILDLRYFNKFLVNQKFCIEDLRLISSTVEQDFEMLTLDLKDGYYHINIAATHRCFLGFSWRFGTSLKIFQFNCVVWPEKCSFNLHQNLAAFGWPLEVSWHQNIHVETTNEIYRIT